MQMPQEYPKALYTGDQTNYEMIVVNNAEQEQEQRELGAADYVDLPKSSPEMKHASGTGANTMDPSALVLVEQFDAVAQKLTDAETEIERLNQVIAAGSAENAELRKQIRLKELEDTSADDLKVLLTERNVPFGARDSKAVLLNLVIESDGSE
jgi:hypothetical protein